MNTVSFNPYINTFCKFDSIDISAHFTDVDTESCKSKVFLQDLQLVSCRDRGFPLRSLGSAILHNPHCFGHLI